MNTQYNIIDIAYEQIKGDYYWAKYGDFKVIMDRETGYINATKLCQLAGNGRSLRHWNENSSSKKLINELSQRIGRPSVDLFDIITGGRNVEIRGTYVHPELIPHILYWANAKFADAVTSIINKFIVERERSRRSTISRSIDLLIQLKAKADARDTLVNVTLPIDRELQCVYFIKSGEFTKIGYTNNLTKRLSSLQVGNPVTLVLLYSILTRHAEQLEADLHRLFSDYRTNGEWFRLPSGAIDDIRDMYSI